MTSLRHRFYLNLLGLVCPTLLFCIGAVQTVRWILLKYGFTLWSDRLEYQITLCPDSTVRAWWLLLLVLPPCVLILWLSQFYGGKILRLKTEAGHPLRIRQKAVNRYIHDCLISLPCVNDVRVQTRSSGGTLAVDLQVWVAATDKLDNLQEQILKQVVRDVKTGFGATKVLEPVVLVESVKAGKGKAATPQRDDSSVAPAEPTLGSSDAGAKPFAPKGYKPNLSVDAEDEDKPKGTDA
jgi:hypothetical protein